MLAAGVPKPNAFVVEGLEAAAGAPNAVPKAGAGVEAGAELPNPNAGVEAAPNAGVDAAPNVVAGADDPNNPGVENPPVEAACMIQRWANKVMLLALYEISLINYRVAIRNFRTYPPKERHHVQMLPCDAIRVLVGIGSNIHTYRTA